MHGAAELSESTIRPLTELTGEERMFQSSVRQFAREEIAPHVREMDETGVFRKDLLRKLFDLGLMSIEIPEEYGGQGGTFFQSVLAVEELAAVDPSASVIVDVQNTLVINAIMRWGSEAQKERYLPMLASGTLGAYALSEAGSGSDAFALQSRAVELGGEYILNGRKLWITNAAEAGLFLVFANIKPEAGYKGITCFLLERDTPGLRLGARKTSWA
jgi:butyryl-CoA dehydrogenase/short/branched chain acyl-CoA dehydrogenase